MLVSFNVLNFRHNMYTHDCFIQKNAWWMKWNSTLNITFNIHILIYTSLRKEGSSSGRPKRWKYSFTSRIFWKEVGTWNLSKKLMGVILHNLLGGHFAKKIRSYHQKMQSKRYKTKFSNLTLYFIPVTVQQTRKQSGHLNRIFMVYLLLKTFFFIFQKKDNN